MDLVGVNVYQPLPSLNRKFRPSEDVKRTAIGWVIDGRCLYWTVRFFHERYGLPVMVTENGMAGDDIVGKDHRVRDEMRSVFLEDYLANLKRAADEGIPILGYQYWSIMDNFEWNQGYVPRFGLVYIDYETQKRVIKDSAYFYRDVIRSNGENLS